MNTQIKKLPVKSIAELPSSIICRKYNEEPQNDFEILGNIMDETKYCWIASGALLQVACVDTGCKIASWKFGTTFKNQDTCITCVCEVPMPAIVGTPLIAVGLQRGIHDGTVCLFTTQGCRVLFSINIGEPVSYICLVDPGGTLNGPLSALDGVLAVGTINGNVLLLDICRQMCIDALTLGPEHCINEDRVRSCLKVLHKKGSSYEPLREMAQAKGEHLAFNIEVMDILGPVTSLLMLSQICALAVGSSTGAVIVIDLIEYKIIYKTQPSNGPVHHLAFQEPSDDPRAHCFMWVVHSSNEGIVANLHQLVFRKKNLLSHGYVYKEFVSGHNPFNLTLADEESKTISCQTIYKSMADECTMSLCIFSWTEDTDSFLCIFDINQWYKTGMPGDANVGSESNFYIVYPIPIDTSTTNYVDVKLDTESITQFKSHQQYDEYFQPGSLSFDCIVLTMTKVARLHWPGLQVNALRKLSNGGSAGLITPTSLYLECLSVHLIPMFHEKHYTCETSVNQQRDMLLSLASDYGYIGYLQGCASAWADGSHAGPILDFGTESSGPTLKTMTDWIWKQSIRAKNRMNALSVQLFDNSGVSLNTTSIVHLNHCVTQFKMLATLLQTIAETCKEFMSPPAHAELLSQKNAIQILAEYSGVLLWLLNIGLLPEITVGNTSLHFSDGKEHVPFPSRVLKQYYDLRREELNRTSVLKRKPVVWGCDLLFIDALIEFECGGSNLRRIWEMDGGSSLYPPDSLQALLWVYLLQDVPIMNKHMLFIYMCLDLTSVLDDERYSMAISHLMKFALVFGVDPSIIKSTQAFWHLDQKEFKSALELLIDPLNQTRGLCRWQHELLLSSLLSQGAHREAMQVMRAPGPAVSPELQIQILIENRLLCEAFEYQRIWGGKQLLEAFFEGCSRYGSTSSIIGLSLTEYEERELAKFLQHSDSYKTDNLRVFYYLQRSRFVEAISANKQVSNHFLNNTKQSQTVSTRDMIVKAFQNTLPEVTKRLTDYCEHDKLFSRIRSADRPTPLSVSMVALSSNDPKTRSSALLASFEKTSETSLLNRGVKRILGVENVPFLRTPKQKITENDKQSLLVYPKIQQNGVEHECCNGNGEINTPLKRMRLETPKQRYGFMKNKSVMYSLNRLSSTPYNFENTNHNTGKQSADNSSLSSLSSPSISSAATNLSLLSTSLVKRKCNSTNTSYMDTPTRTHSILKVPGTNSDKKLSKKVSHISLNDTEPSSRSIHFADDMSTASEISDLDMDVATNEEAHKSPKMKGVQSRRSLRSSRSSIESTKAIITTSTSTGDDIYYSLSSGTDNEKERQPENLKSEFTRYEVTSSHSSNDSGSQSSRASSDKEIEKELTERSVLSGPKPRRSLRLSRGNDSLHKLSSSITKAKTKINDSVTQKLLDLAAGQNRSLNRIVLESNAYKVNETFVKKKLKGPRVRDSIHSHSEMYNDENKDVKNCDTTESRSVRYSLITENHEYNHNEDVSSSPLKKISTEDRSESKDMESVSEKNKRSSSSQKNGKDDPIDEQGNIPIEKRSENQEDHIEVSTKTDSIYNDVYGEQQENEMDIYADLMSDINESIRQKSQARKCQEDVDIEPMQTCPDLFLSDEVKKSDVDIAVEDKKLKVGKEKHMDRNKTVYKEQTDIKEVQKEQYNEIEEHNICILSASSITTEEFNQQSVASSKIQNLTKNVIEHQKLNELRADENEVKEPTEDKKDTSEDSKKDDEEPDTITIDSSEDGSVGEHNVGAIELKGNSKNSSETAEESGEEESDYSEESDEEEGKNHERNILGETELDRYLEEGEIENEAQLEEQQIEDDFEGQIEDGECVEEEQMEGDDCSEDEEIEDEGHLEEGEIDGERLGDGKIENEEREEEQLDEVQSEEGQIEDSSFEQNDEEQSEEGQVEDSSFEQNEEEEYENEGEEIDDVEKNIDAISRGSSVSECSSRTEQYSENSNSVQCSSEGSRSVENDNNNVTELVVPQNENEESENDCAVVISESEEESEETEKRIDSPNCLEAEMVQEGGDEDCESDAGESVLNLSATEKESSECLETIDDNERLQLSVEDLSTAHCEVKTTVNCTIDAANITDDLSVIENVEEDKFVSFENNEKSSIDRVSSDNKLENASLVKSKDLTSESFTDAMSETDILERTPVVNISNLGDQDILDRTSLSKTPFTSKMDREIITNTVEADPDTTKAVDIFDKTQRFQDVSDIGEDDILDKSISEIGKEVPTPKQTPYRRRSSRLTPLETVEEDARSEDFDNCSIASDASAKSTRSRMRLLGTPTKSLDYTPRRSSRIRSAESSPASDIDVNVTSRTRRNSKSGLDSPAAIPSPRSAPKGSVQRGRRKSLLATLSEPVILEEKPDDENLQLVDEYSKERRLTRQQRSMLIRSLGSSERAPTPKASTFQETNVAPLKRKRANSRSTEYSESGEDLAPISESPHAVSPSGSESSTRTTESTRARRACFLKAQSVMASSKTVKKRTRLNSASEKDDYDSDNSASSVKLKSTKVSYKFSNPTGLDHSEKDMVDIIPSRGYEFSPPKYPFKSLPVIDEERSLSPSLVENSDTQQNADILETNTKITPKKGRPRKNSTSSNKSTKTRSSSRNSNK